MTEHFPVPVWACCEAAPGMLWFFRTTLEPYIVIIVLFYSMWVSLNTLPFLLLSFFLFWNYLFIYLILCHTHQYLAVFSHWDAGIILATVTYHMYISRSITNCRSSSFSYSITVTFDDPYINQINIFRKWVTFAGWASTIDGKKNSTLYEKKVATERNIY